MHGTSIIMDSYAAISGNAPPVSPVEFKNRIAMQEKLTTPKLQNLIYDVGMHHG